MATALWKRIDTQGHDAAVLTQEGAARRLEGMASFATPDGPVSVSYQVLSDETGATESACIEGRDPGGRFAHRIVRDAAGWRLDGRVMGLGHLLHLDLGFTPATNALQMLRERPALHRTASFSVAWFDIGESSLVELPQIYRRAGPRRYDYESPLHHFRGSLEFGRDDFVCDYPGLWRREA